MDEVKQLVEAIDGLKGGLFKDYVYPIAMALVSTFLGAAVAFWTVRHQENVKIEKDKLSIANRWILKMEEARTNLFAIKRNYHGELTDHPFERLAVVPTNPVKHKRLDEDYTNLTFVVPHGLHPDAVPYRWSQITRIRAILSNYNELMGIWERRHDLNEKFKDSIQSNHPGHLITGISFQDAINAHGPDNMLRLIDCNETALRLTDSLLEEFTDYVVNFPGFVQTKIDLKLIKRHGTLISYYGDTSDELYRLLQRSPRADYRNIEGLFRESAEQIERRYSSLM